MNKPLLILPVLCVLPALQSCTTEQKTSSLPWKITPVMEVRNSTENPEAYYQLGRFYQGQSRHEMAAKEFEKAIAINPKYADAHNALGVSYAALGKLDLAVNQFNAAIALDPEVSRFHNNLGYAQYLKQDYAPAVAELKKAVALDPIAEKANTNYQHALAQASTAPVAPVVAQNTTTTVVQPAPVNNPVAPVAQTKPLPAMTVTAEPTQPHLDSAKDLATVSTNKEAPVAPPIAATAVTQNTTVVQPVVANNPTTPVAQTKVLPAMVATPVALPAALVESTTAGSSAPLPSTEVVVKTPATPTAAAIPPVTTIPAAKPAAAIAKNDDAVMPPQTIPTAVAPATADPAPSAPGSEPAGKEQEPLAVAVTVPVNLSVQQKPSNNEATKRELSFDVLKGYRFEIANGNGVTGMARQVNRELLVIGLPRAHLTNQKPFRQPTTFVQYRAGYKELAVQLSAQLPNNPPTRENNQLRASTNVRLVLGKDVAHGLALLYKARLTDTKLVLNQTKLVKPTPE